MSRLEKLRARLAQAGAEALLVSGPENRRYLSGFTGSAGYLLITPSQALLITDFRYTQQGKKEAPGWEVVEVRGEVGQWLPELFSPLKMESLGFESPHLSYALYEQLQEAFSRLNPTPHLLPTQGVVEGLRAVKEPGELELLQQAAALADAAARFAQERAQPGMTEQALAWEIERFLREAGSGGLPFDLIVASGPNGAMAHAHPTPRPLTPGEPIVLDLGAKVDGYHSDLTRTFCLGQPFPGKGQPDATFRRLYPLVLQAQQAAIEGIRVGMTGAEADALARGVLEAAGFGEAFGHGLGHGVGLATHEDPRLGTASPHILEAGMVFTIEPGVYLPGWGGIRIEDLALLQPGGVRLLSSAPK